MTGPRRHAGEGAARGLDRAPARRFDALDMDDVTIPIDEIYVPAGRRRQVDPARVEEIAESILERGLEVPISVRPDGARYVLVSGLQRLEACKALGEETITAILVGSPQR